MLLPPPGVHEAEVPEAFPADSEMGGLYALFLRQARAAASDADEPFVL